MDNQKVGVLILLDLSFSFFRSYLEGRFQQVKIGGQCSSKQRLEYGVPQGSVLGPQLFNVYTAPLGRIIRAHGFECHFYADDTQIYISVKPVQADMDTAVSDLQKCIDDIRVWMRENFLKLNDDKTEVLVFGSRQQLAKVTIPGVRIGDSLISSVSSVRNLGGMFDTEMSMRTQVNTLCNAARFHIRSIGKIRRYLDKESCEKVVHAFVTSRLDMNNSLLAGLPSTVLVKLQRCQNIAARVITRTRATDHITPVLMDLHWLPVTQRIKYKLLLYVYRALNGMAPAYLAELIRPYVAGRRLRSSDTYLLCVPHTRHSWGDRAFSKAAPVLWNSLPIRIKSAPSLTLFKSSLKTFLYQEAFLPT